MSLQNTSVRSAAGLAGSRQHKTVAKDTGRGPSAHFTTGIAFGDNLATDLTREAQE